MGGSDTPQDSCPHQLGIRGLQLVQRCWENIPGAEIRCGSSSSTCSMPSSTCSSPRLDLDEDETHDAPPGELQCSPVVESLAHRKNRGASEICSAKTRSQTSSGSCKGSAMARKN